MQKSPPLRMDKLHKTWYFLILFLILLVIPGSFGVISARLETVNGSSTDSLHLNLDNWNFIDGWNEFSDPEWSFNEAKLNETVLLLTASTPYNATSIQLVSGTLDSGNLQSVHVAKDNDSYSISEASGPIPIDVRINFTGVEQFNQIILREYYQGGAGHTLKICLWDYSDLDWECEYNPDIAGEDDFAFSIRNVIDDTTHISGGLVQLRIYHVQNGIPSHNFFIDFAQLISGFSSISTEEADPFAFHKSGDTPMMGDADWNGYDLNNVGDFDATGDITGGSFTLDSNTITSWDDVNVTSPPGGSNGQIQFNDGGAFGGNADFTYDVATGDLTVGEDTVSGGKVEFLSLIHI